MAEDNPENAYTPIPGLRVEVMAELQSTPIAVYEVRTDKDGRPLSTIEVDSASDIVISSLDEQIAKFAASGPASEFAAPLAPAIVATPMIEPAGVCRTQIEGTPVVQFKYSNANDAGTNTLVPITGLDPELYRTPETVDDDLLLNSIRSSDGEIIADTSYRAPAPNETSQLFASGENQFVVPYDTSAGPLTWSFIGSETVVDGSTALCKDEGVIRCEVLPSQLVEQLVVELRNSVSNTLKAAARWMRIGKSPYLHTGAQAIRRIRSEAAGLTGAYICPQGAALPSSCRVTKFPIDELARIHASIFSKPSPVRPKVFAALAKSYNTRYRRFLNRTFPREIVICNK
ncbi:MAG: hypothetical protein ACK5GN_14005 [Pseudomonadota bacterium]